MAEYVASLLFRRYLDMLERGVRDIENPDLAPYYDGPAAPPAEVTANLALTQILLNKVNLSIAASDFSIQSGPPSTQIFTSVIEGAGIERTFSDDLFLENSVAQLPDVGFRTSFSSERSYDRTAVSMLREAAGIEGSDIDHLRSPALPVLADADSYARIKIQRAKEFVRRYLVIR